MINFLWRSFHSNLPKTMFSFNAISHTGPYLSYSLPSVLRDAALSSGLFRKLLETYLFPATHAFEANS